MHVPLASNGLSEQQISDAISVLRSGNLTMGINVERFERAMATYLGVSNFVMVNSGSSANLAIFEFMLRPSKGAPLLRAGDEVLVPAIAWPTTVWPILQLGLKPIFVDVLMSNLAIDLEHAQELVSTNKNIRAIFPIHPLGFGIDGLALEAFAKNNRLILVSDVCESLGSFPRGKHAGIGGSAASFSFYFSHHITTMEGGGVATESEEMSDDLRSIRSHGWSRDRSDHNEWFEDVSTFDKKFTFVSSGYNIRPMEIQAAIGLSEVPRIDEYVRRRRDIARHVFEEIQRGGVEIIGGELLHGDEQDSHSWMHIPIRLHGNKSKKDKVVQALNSLGVETRPILTGNFLHQPAARRFLGQSQGPEIFTKSEQIAGESFLVGCHHSFTDSQVSYLADSLSKALTVT